MVRGGRPTVVELVTLTAVGGTLVATAQLIFEVLVLMRAGLRRRNRTNMVGEQKRIVEHVPMNSRVGAGGADCASAGTDRLLIEIRIHAWVRENELGRDG
jgi:hypothetical protein